MNAAFSLNCDVSNCNVISSSSLQQRKTGEFVTVSFSTSRALPCAYSQTHFVSFCVSSRKGFMRSNRYGTNLQRHFERPTRRRMAVTSVGQGHLPNSLHFCWISTKDAIHVLFRFFQHTCSMMKKSASLSKSHFDTYMVGSYNH